MIAPVLLRSTIRVATTLRSEKSVSTAGCGCDHQRTDRLVPSSPRVNGRPPRNAIGPERKGEVASVVALPGVFAFEAASSRRFQVSRTRFGPLAESAATVLPSGSTAADRKG